MTLTEQEVRNINLIELLVEEAEDEGREIAEPPPDAPKWTEARIRKYFELGRDAGPPGFAPPPEAAFDAAFPGLARSQTACERPRLRVVAFPNAGSAEDMYTSEGTGVRRASSPLLDWCRANGAEVLAVQLPGRALRSKEPYTRSAQEVAAALVPLLGSRLADTPYVLVGHSLGSWLAYEFAAACRDAGLPPPRQAFLSALAAPDIPFDRRPWRQQAGLDEEDFKDECRGWSVAELVFDKAMWPVYHPLLRADFRLFDEYKHRRTGEPPFDFPIHTFWGVDDARIPKDLVEGWRSFTTGRFECDAINGNHLWPLQPDAKRAWLSAIAQALEALRL